MHLRTIPTDVSIEIIKACFLIESIYRIMVILIKGYKINTYKIYDEPAEIMSRTKMADDKLAPSVCHRLLHYPHLCYNLCFFVS